MAYIGLRNPKYAIYNNSNGTITYTDGGVMGKAVSVDISVQAADNNDFYADDGLAETDSRFESGELTISTDNLSQTVTAALMGVTPTSIPTSYGLTDTTAKQLIFDKNAEVPYIGFGIVETMRVNGADAYRAIVLAKVKFNPQSDSVTTKGETIDWQTPELTGAIMRDDSANERWKYQADFDTYADADLYINGVLGITSASSN